MVNIMPSRRVASVRAKYEMAVHSNITSSVKLIVI